MSKNKEKENTLVLNQEPPTPNDEPGIWDLVIEDCKARHLEGQKKYGTKLQAFNGRNAAIDLYQEQLDGLVYTRQLIIERSEMIRLIWKLYKTYGDQDAKNFLERTKELDTETTLV